MKIEEDSDDDEADEADEADEEPEVPIAPEEPELEGEVVRDQSFVANLDYLVSKQDGIVDDKLVPVPNDENNPTPKGFCAFMRDGARYFIRKASLVWLLGVEGKRVSTDRVYRFISGGKEHGSEGKIMLGDFVHMTFEKKVHLVQILGFKFNSNKAFYGDFYDLKRKAEGVQNQVLALCGFFKEENGEIIAENRVQRFINTSNYKDHVFVKRDMDSGTLKIQ